MTANPTRDRLAPQRAARLKKIAEALELAATYIEDGDESTGTAIALLAVLAIEDTDFKRRLAVVQELAHIRSAVATAISEHTGECV